MQHLIKIAGILFLFAGTLSAQDFSGRWTGAAETIDEGGVKRTERQTIDIKLADGKVMASRVNRNGSSSQLEVHSNKTKINLVEVLKQDGGDEYLRWKFELKDGKLVGIYTIVHDNPEKWQYDRIGPMTLAKVETAPAQDAKPTDAPKPAAPPNSGK